MIPIKQAEGFAIANGLTQVIIFGFDGKDNDCLTWGETLDDKAQVEHRVRAIKKSLGWIEGGTDTSVVNATEEKPKMPALENAVHIIEGTEFERGWGCRPDGFAAFLTKEAADNWMNTYNARHNSAQHAPDIYTSYTYLGIKKCSQQFLTLLHINKKNSNKKPMHFFNNLDQLTK